MRAYINYDLPDTGHLPPLGDGSFTDRRTWSSADDMRPKAVSSPKNPLPPTTSSFGTAMLILYRYMVNRGIDIETTLWVDVQVEVSKKGIPRHLIPASASFNSLYHATRVHLHLPQYQPSSRYIPIDRPRAYQRLEYGLKYSIIHRPRNHERQYFNMNQVCQMSKNEDSQ